MKKFYFKILVVLLVLSSNLPFINQVNATTKTKELMSEGFAAQLPGRQIPKLTEIFQVSTNQILVTFDRNVDINLGTKASFYWIQSVTDATPSGIASLGKNSKIIAQNALSNQKVTITKVQGDNYSFLLTFKKEIPSNKRYKLIVRNLHVPGGSPYNGDNGIKVFTSK